jgi:hypothetical protein
MKQSEMQELPQRVRERYNQLCNNPSWGQDNPGVITARRILAEGEARRQIALDALLAHQEKQEALTHQREEAARELAALDSERPERLARVLLGDGPQDFDEDTTRRAELAQMIARIDLAWPVIVARGEARRADVHRCRLDEHEEDHLVAILERLRIAEAWKL